VNAVLSGKPKYQKYCFLVYQIHFSTTELLFKCCHLYTTCRGDSEAQPPLGDRAAKAKRILIEKSVIKEIALLQTRYLSALNLGTSVFEIPSLQRGFAKLIHLLNQFPGWFPTVVPATSQRFSSA
jgi:hypothetical protein